MRDVPDSPAARCPRCGVEMRPDTLGGLCPACLLARASEPISDLSDAMTTLTPPSASRTQAGAGSDARPTLVPGQTFGAYRVVRLLGRGGMGEVYEAEQIEQGRRVALKVLGRRLTDPHDRARFLREGQLAASLNHPHSVYIFGSEEIAGTPVIAMELLAGGTLKDRVREQGPLPPAEAVDAILQIIAGLDAAQAGGILHRDIKPANCFVDRDGTVKIGDFGLSISTTARDVTQLTKAGGFQGTPQFAAPEQLRGEPLDVRADIYAVGATLDYLLTGQPPFDDTDLMSLLTRIAAEVPRSPRALQPRVPRGLAAIVLRCLAKDRKARPATYAALDEVLRPFGSSAATPATMGLRFLAGTIDWIIVSMTLTPLSFAMVFRWSVADVPWWTSAIGTATLIAYFGILEGVWGASVGKRLARLRVTNADDGQPPGMARAFWRAVIFETPLAVSALPSIVLGQKRLVELMTASPWFGFALSAALLVPIGVLFSTARRRNGFAAVHDLVSRTRVVRRLERPVRSALDAARDPARAAGRSAHRYGPYEVVRTLGPTDLGELWLGFDPTLRRHVWIHTLAPGAAAVAPLIRDLSRPGRLRWLSGRRSTHEAWDAYEALDGVPLATFLEAPGPWRTVRPWLLDLAREIDAGLSDGSLAPLTLDHVWITREGYAKLLDFRAPGVPPGASPEEAATLQSGQTFLAFIARHATTSREPLPQSASAVLENLARRELTSWSEVVARTGTLLQTADRVGRGRRAVPLILCGVMPTLMALMFLVMVPLISRMITSDMMALNDALLRLSFISQRAGVGSTQERAALEVYIAGRFRSMIVDPQTWVAFPLKILVRERVVAERVVAEHPNVSADELAAATAALGPFLRGRERQRDFNASLKWWIVPLTMFVVTLTLIALFGIVWAFVLRGGLFLRVCGIAVVTGDGKPASRLRALWRGLLAWVIVPAAFGLGIRLGAGVGVGVGVLFLAGAAWAVVHPTRGLQDRIAGTWLVPR